MSVDKFFLKIYIQQAGMLPTRLLAFSFGESCSLKVLGLQRKQILISGFNALLAYALPSRPKAKRAR